MSTDELTPTESNALKWVLLCEHFKLSPLDADVPTVLAAASGRKMVKVKK